MATLTSAAPDTSWRSRAAVLASGTFVVGTDAFVISGVLPSVSGSLHVSLAAAGQLITVFALSYALLAPVLGTLTARWSRPAVLVAALGVLAVGNAVTALGTAYGMVLAARVIAAAGAALYTATASATAATLAGEAHRGKAISIVVLGTTSSLVLGAPLGTAVGEALGWRATLWCVAALALVIAPVVALALPRIRIDAPTGLRARLAPLRDRRILGVLLITLVSFVGIYIPYSYIAAVFAPATATGGPLSVLILAFGIAGTAGNLTAGRAADRRGPRTVLIAALSALVVVFAVMPALRGAFAPALVITVVSGFFSFCITTPQQHMIVARASDGTRALVTALYQSAAYLAVALSGAVGAAGLDIAGAGGLPWIAAALVLAALVLTVVTGRAPRR
ncbi:MAG TPA: MFS transporter [Streptosporangiaceae bacterium]